jgi:hypothetical protein
MSARWQSPILAAALCAVLVGGPSANSARAQCSHASGVSSRFSPGLLQQQQLLLQQQQLFQQVQQQQLLQTARLDKQMRDLAKEGPEAIKAALKGPNADMRLIAALTVGKYGPALTDDLIERLTDDNALVRQAARRGLVSLSTKRDGKPTGGRGVDFGPAVDAKSAAQKSAARKWSTWFARQQKRQDDLKAVAAKTAARSPTPAKDAPLAPVAVNQKTRP